MHRIVELFPEELERVTGGDRGFVLPSEPFEGKTEVLVHGDADRGRSMILIDGRRPVRGRRCGAGA